MKEIILLFKTWLHANSKSRHTIRAYTESISTFFEMTGVQDVKQITEPIVNKYFADIKAQIGQSTCNRHISALKSFLDFQNIALRLPKTKTPMKKEVKIIEKPDFYTKVLPMLDKIYGSESLKPKAIICFLYFCGLRCEDATEVKRDQIHLDENYARVIITKQNIEKDILLPNAVIDILRKYFATEPEMKGAFNTSVRGITYIFEQLNQNLPELQLHPHKFRKSFATNARDLGMELEEVQEFLGHKHIETTQIYVRPKRFEVLKEKYLRLEAEQLKKKIKGQNGQKPKEQEM